MITILFIIGFLVVISVTIHYQFLLWATDLMPKMRIRHRFRIVFGIGVAFFAHVLEVWVFAIAYYILLQQENWGSLEGNFNGSLLDCSYFSFTTYTTLGFGDIAPLGEIRYLTGIESLTGLVLITWTASFLFIEMQRCWRLN